MKRVLLRELDPTRRLLIEVSIAKRGLRKRLYFGKECRLIALASDKITLDNLKYVVKEILRELPAFSEQLWKEFEELNKNVLWEDEEKKLMAFRGFLLKKLAEFCFIVEVKKCYSCKHFYWSNEHNITGKCVKFNKKRTKRLSVCNNWERVILSEDEIRQFNKFIPFKNDTRIK